MTGSVRAFEHGALAGATEELHDALREMARTLSLHAGRAVFEQGDPGDAIFAVLSGEVEISVVSEDGRKLVLNVLYPGQVFGEIALFDAGPRTASAMALVPTELALVGRDAITRALRSDPDFAEEILALAGSRLRWISGQFEDLAFLPLEVRLARRLLFLSAVSPRVSAALEISQSELAEHVGATREAVSKILARWRADGLVKLGRGRIEISDRMALKSLAREIF